MKTKIKEYKAETNLEQSVKDIIIDEIINLDDSEIERWFNDLFAYGCESVIVTSMIYYVDTLKFFNRHKEEINVLLSETLNQLGYECPSKIFEDKWNKTDPLVMEITNQNLLAWFAFEETAGRMFDEITEE